MYKGWVRVRILKGGADVVVIVSTREFPFWLMMWCGKWGVWGLSIVGKTGVGG